MKKLNVFNGEGINKIVAQSLNYHLSDEQLMRPWFTEDIFLSAFFYLSKRFGEPQYLDDAKEGGTWHFIVKDYEISVHLNSSWVTFIVYGNYSRFQKSFLTTPYQIRERREWGKKSDQLIDPWSDKFTEGELVTLNKMWQPFLKQNKFEGMSQKDILGDFENVKLWHQVIKKYNESIMRVNWKEFAEKYGKKYENAATRHAKRTLSQFVKNMLTPIYIRDIPYNIKGSISDRDASDYSRYEKNVSIFVDKRFVNGN